MPRASKMLSEEQKKTVEQAIEDAEKRTSAEIVVVMATQSGRYDRAEDQFGLLFAIICICLGWIFGQELEPLWGGGWRVSLGLAPLLIILVGGWVAGVALATFIPMLARPVVPGNLMRDEVQRTACEAFYRSRVRRTEGATGILLYVSIYERMTWIVGDEAIAHEISDGAWSAARDAVVDGFKSGKPVDGLVAGIMGIADVVSEKFPRAEDDKDELPNAIHFID